MPKKHRKNSIKDDQRKELCQELYEVCIQPNELKFETRFLKIYTILEKLNEIENKIPFCCESSRNETDFSNFIKFLNDHNCKLENNLSIKTYDQTGSNYGLKSNKSFKKGDLIFEIPNGVILTLKDTTGTQLDSLIKNDKMLSLMPNVALSLFILFTKINHQNDEKLSKWTPYLNILPSEFHTPLYFNLDELKMLKFSQCFSDILNHIVNIARQYAYIFNLLDSKKEFDEFKSKFSFRNFKWAVSIVSTRQNQIYDENQKPLLAMIPLLDMCNHEEGEFCTDFNDDTKSALCFANKDINIEDNITIFYGSRTNRDMLIHNGFVCEVNNHDSIKLKFGMSAQDSWALIRTNVLEKFGLNSSESFEISANSAQEICIPAGLYFYVKVFTAKTIGELDEIGDFEPKDVEVYFKAKSLESNEQIKEFLKQRLLILSKLYEKQNQPSLNTTNSMFIQRLLNSEHKLIKLFLAYLNK